MPEYEELLRRANSKLPKNTAAARKRNYEKARTAVAGVLESVDLPTQDKARYRQELEVAISMVEGRAVLEAPVENPPEAKDDLIAELAKLMAAESRTRTFVEKPPESTEGLIAELAKLMAAEARTRTPAPIEFSNEERHVETSSQSYDNLDPIDEIEQLIGKAVRIEINAPEANVATESPSEDPERYGSEVEATGLGSDGPSSASINRDEAAVYPAARSADYADYRDPKTIDAATELSSTARRPATVPIRTVRVLSPPPNAAPPLQRADATGFTATANGLDVAPQQAHEKLVVTPDQVEAYRALREGAQTALALAGEAVCRPPLWV